MNYIVQLNRFYDCLQTNSLSASAICLYGVLLHINNKCAWIKEFTVANINLQGMCHLSRVQIDRARNELMQKGYIHYKKGSGNRAGKYLIVCFDAKEYTQSVEQTVHSASTLNKSDINKTKNSVIGESVFSRYEKLWGTINSTTAESLGAFLDAKMEAELICYVLDEAHADGKRWRYAQAVLQNCLKESVFTLAEFKLRQEAWRAKAKKPAKNNENPFANILKEEGKL